MITIGTDCSGIEAPIEALNQLGITYKHLWSCEIDSYARKSILANYHPDKIYEDITTRDHSLLPDVDIYVCGFPCQSFSLMGKKKGTEDPRSNIMLHCIDVIKQKTPRVFILENVKNFKFIEKGKPFNYLINELSNILDNNNESYYNIYYDIYNTKDYGIPQNRERVYIIGIRKDIQINEFVKPESVNMRPLDEFIQDKTIYEFSSNDKMLKTNLKKMLSIEKNKNNIITPFTYYHTILDCCPTLTTRCSVFYHSIYNRTLSIIDCLLLQGFRTSFKVVVSKHQMCKQIGNSMSVNVVKAILNQILNCSVLNA